MNDRYLQKSLESVGKSVSIAHTQSPRLWSVACLLE